MKIETHDSGEVALTVQFRREEIPVFRAALERAMFSDTPPELQSAVVDLLHRLVDGLPDEPSG